MGVYWQNVKSIVSLMPSTSIGTRLACRLLPGKSKLERRNIGLQLGYNLLQAGTLYQGRIFPSELSRALPHIASLMPEIEELPEDHFIYNRTNVASSFTLPRITPKGLWTTFGLIIQPKQLSATLEQLEQKYDHDLTIQGISTIDLETHIENLTRRLAIKTTKIKRLVRELEGHEKLIDFTREISQMIVQDIPYEQFVHNLCRILYEVAGLRRCIAFIYDEEQDALIAQEKPGSPNPWASLEPENTDEIQAFLRRDGRAVLSVPISQEGQTQMAKELIARAITLAPQITIAKAGSKTALRTLKGIGATVFGGKQILPEGWEKDSSESVITQCFKTGEILVVNDTANPEHPVSRVLIHMWKSRTFIAAPIKIGDKVIGVFGLDHDLSPQTITKEVERQVALLVDMASIGFSLRRYTDALERTLGKHIGPKVKEAIMSRLLSATPSDFPPQNCDCTVMFTDIMGFTGITRKLNDLGKAAVFLEFVTDYRNWMAGAIIKHGALLDKYIGDAHMLLWGTPVAKHDDDPERALQTAIAMQREAHHFFNTTKWKEIFASLGIENFGIRAGIDTGDIMVGVIADLLRHEFTAIGEAVNRAARFEGKAKGSDGSPGILISEETFNKLSPAFIEQYVKEFNEAVREYLKIDYQLEDDDISQHYCALKTKDIFAKEEVEIKIGDEMVTAKTYQVEWDRKKWKKRVFDEIWMKIWNEA